MRTLKWLGRYAEELIAGFGLVVVVLSVCWGVLTRYVTEQPAAWAGELAQIAFAWVVFLGSAAGFKYGMHISIDMVVAKLPRPARNALQTLGDVLVLSFLAYVIWLAVLFNIESWGSPTPALQVSRSTAYGSVLFGLGFMMVRYIQAMRHRASGATDPLFRIPGQIDEPDAARG